MHISRTTALATSGLIAIGAVLAADIAVPTGSAQAAEQRAAALTARVTKIQHGPGLVTLAGTAAAGSHVFLGGDVQESATATADADGAWTATVRTGVGEHGISVASDTDWKPIQVRATVLVTTPPTMLAEVDGTARTIRLEGSGHPRANIVLSVDGTRVGTAKADADGSWWYVLRGLSFGKHHVAAAQRFDGAQNGGVDDVYEISGAPTLTTSEVDVDEARIRLAGTAPTGTTIGFRTEAGDAVVGADGNPVVAAVAEGGSWWAHLPLPSGDARLYALDAVTSSDGTEVGATRMSVTIPVPLTARAEALGSDSIRLSGSGEPGATVSFTHENGAPLRDRDGQPVTTTIGRGDWQRTIDARGVSGARVLVVQRVGDRVAGRAAVTLP